MIKRGRGRILAHIAIVIFGFGSVLQALLGHSGFYWPFAEYRMFASVIEKPYQYSEIILYGVLKTDHGSREEIMGDSPWITPFSRAYLRKTIRTFVVSGQTDLVHAGLKKLLLQNRQAGDGLIGFRLYRERWQISPDEKVVLDRPHVKELLVDETFE
jgi:hypothetical protein